MHKFTVFTIAAAALVLAAAPAMAEDLNGPSPCCACSGGMQCGALLSQEGLTTLSGCVSLEPLVCVGGEVLDAKDMALLDGCLCDSVTGCVDGSGKSLSADECAAAAVAACTQSGNVTSCGAPSPTPAPTPTPRPGNSGCSGTVQNGGGQNSCNLHGLCTAYFAGSDNGQQHKHQAPPFQALQNAACSGGPMDCGAGECSCFNGRCEDLGQCVADFCPDTNPGGHGRNPSNGSPGQAKK